MLAESPVEGVGDLLGIILSLPSVAPFTPVMIRASPASLSESSSNDGVITTNTPRFPYGVAEGLGDDRLDAIHASVEVIRFQIVLVQDLLDPRSIPISTCPRPFDNDRGTN